jgi:hypothetical protein
LAKMIFRPGCFVKEVPLDVRPPLIISCEECAFTIPCFSGKFVNDDQRMPSFTTYCPGCEVLTYMPLPEDSLEEANTNNVMQIRCAVRCNENFVQEYMRVWDNTVPLSALPMLFESLWEGKTVLTKAPDPGPGTLIHVAMCARCCTYNAGLESKRHALETFACEVRHRRWMRGGRR